MALENLQSFRWEQGTLASPVPLIKAEFTGLVNLILKGKVEKDIRGYIKPLNAISSYEDYVVRANCPQLTLVDAEIKPVEYNVFLDSDSVNEGNRVKINVTGIGLSALKFRITGHTVQTPELRDRTTIDTANGYVVVAPAQENSTWDDVVTFQTCPVWEEWSDPNASIKNINITVHAVAVSSVTLTAPSVVSPTKTFYPTVNFLPAGNTKPKVTSRSDAANGLYFEASSDDFTVAKRDANTIIATAPATESPTGQPYILRCNVYAFTLDNVFAALSANIQCKYPYIQFIITTDGTFSDISTANPKITLQKVDSEDTPIGEPVILTGTVSGSSLVYTYGNSNVAGDGSETYKVSIEKVQGYTTPNIVNITPNEVITEVSASYNVIQPNVYIVYTDGTEQQYDDFVLNGMQFLDNKTPNYIHIIDSRKEFGVAILDALILERFAITSLDNLRDYGLDSIVLESSMNNSEKIAALFTILDATKNNLILSSIFSNVDNAIKTCKEYSIVYKEETRNGYLPSSGEAAIICNNMIKIINIWKANGVETNITAGNIWTSTIDKNQGRIICVRFSGNSVTDGDKLTPGSTSTRYVVPCFTL